MKESSNSDSMSQSTGKQAETSNELVVDYLADVPDRLILIGKSPKPNKPIKLYSGDMTLDLHDNSVPMETTIKWEWFPSPGPRIYAAVPKGQEFAHEIDGHIGGLNVSIDGLGKGQTIASRIAYKWDDSLDLELRPRSIFYIGDPSINVSYVDYMIINNSGYDGRDVKRVKKLKGKDNKYLESTRARLEFQNITYRITVEQEIKFKKHRDALQLSSGYAVLGHARISKLDGPISSADAQEEISIFSSFLSFLDANRVTCIVGSGIFESEVKWTDLSSYLSSPFKNTTSWRPSDVVVPVENIWPSFRELYKQAGSNSFLQDALHWYIEANRRSGLIDGSLIFCQTALELIYNYWIVEKLSLIHGKDAENLTASNKIRLIISQIAISSKVPERLEEIHKLMDGDQTLEDGPDVITYLRNALVHGQASKRKAYHDIGGLVKHQVLELGIWYCELALLRILNYRGMYYNRCGSGRRNIGCEELVPWAKGAEELA